MQSAVPCLLLRNHLHIAHCTDDALILTHTPRLSCHTISLPVHLSLFHLSVATYEAMALPLRIRAERHSAAKFGGKQTFILPSKEENEVCLIIHDSGVVSLVVSNQGSLNSQQRLCSLLGLNDFSALPKYCLVIEDSSDRTSSSDPSDRNHKTCRWIETSTGADASKADKEAIIRSAISSQDSSRIVVEAIERYYGRQVLEPSIRGFLSILEKQFPSNNLYFQ